MMLLNLTHLKACFICYLNLNQRRIRPKSCISFRYATTDGITQCIRPTWIVRVILIASERNATKMTYLGICQIGCIWNARFLTVKCISFSLMHLISFAKFTSGQPHLSNCHLSNQMLLAFEINCNWCKLYASGHDPQFDINFARAVHFDFGRMRLRKREMMHMAC